MRVEEEDSGYGGSRQPVSEEVNDENTRSDEERSAGSIER